MPLLRWLRRRIFTRENLLALSLAILIILLIVISVDPSPDWIYQGF